MRRDLCLVADGVTCGDPHCRKLPRRLLIVDGGLTRAWWCVYSVLGSGSAE